jgi:MFS transporter, SP family, arabinose:H+ symporter
MLNANPNEKRARAYLYFVSTVVAGGGFNWSYNMILMSGAILYLKSYFSIGRLSWVILSHTVSPSWIEGLTMSAGILGTAAGMLAGSHLADEVGRKRSLFLGAMGMGLGAIGSATASTLMVSNIFRLVGGMGGGLAFLVAPMYISEIAPTENRGSLVTLNQLAIVLAALAANFSTYVTGKYFGSNPACWRWMYASACLPLVIFIVGLFFVPETPRWLLMKARREEALEVLARVGAAAHADQTVKAIAESLRDKSASLRELIAPGMRIASLIALGLAILEQWIGLPTLTYYAPSLFVKAGVSSNAGAIGNTVLLRVWDSLWTLCAIFWVDRFGRRPLLLMGAMGTAAGLFLMGLCYYHNANPTIVLLTFFLCDAAFNSSLPSVAWLVVTEIFPTPLRARGMAIHGSIRFASLLVLAQVFPPLAEFFRSHFGSEASVFWFFSIIGLVTVAFCFLLVPETKNKTLEEASKSYARC